MAAATLLLPFQPNDTLKRLPRAISGEVFPFGRMTLYKAFGRAVHRAGIKNLTFHDLRHEALSTLAELGDLNVLELATVSGHRYVIIGYGVPCARGG
jgi:integrase